MRDDAQEDDRGSINGEDEGSSREEEEEEEEEEMGPKVKRIDPYANWDNGEPLTPEERAQLMKLSTYERAREMNIRRRQRMDSNLTSEFKTLTDDATRSHSKPAPAPRKPKTKAPASNESLRRSSRTSGAK